MYANLFAHVPHSLITHLLAQPQNYRILYLRASGSLLTFKKILKIVLTLNQRDNISLASICDSRVFSDIQRP